jgi:hypothetical protein
MIDEAVFNVHNFGAFGDGKTVGYASDQVEAY